MQLIKWINNTVSEAFYKNSFPGQLYFSETVKIFKHKDDVSFHKNGWEGIKWATGPPRLSRMHSCIIGGNCHKYHFCHDKTHLLSMFVMTKHVFVTTNTILSCRGKHNFVVTKDVFCCDKHMFIMTKVLLSRLKSYLWQLLPMILLSVTFQHPSSILCHTWLHHRVSLSSTLPPYSAILGYTTEGALVISICLPVSHLKALLCQCPLQNLQRVWVLIWWTQHSIEHT